MLITKKVIEDAIKEREDELKHLKYIDSQLIGENEFLKYDIENFESHL